MPAANQGHRIGVVLAADAGSRLVSGGAALKPLVRVGGVPLIVRTLRGLAFAGCSRAIVVVGYRAAELQFAIETIADLALPVRFVVNPDFELANGVSLLSAVPLLTEEFVLVMADHLFGEEIMCAARSVSPPVAGARLCVDCAIENVFDLEDATKVESADGRLVRIGKNLPTSTASTLGCSSPHQHSLRPSRNSGSVPVMRRSPTRSRHLRLTG
jgi:1L-myo-inositol 1-phosphate cytidylyltransferase